MFTLFYFNSWIVQILKKIHHKTCSQKPNNEWTLLQIQMVNHAPVYKKHGWKKIMSLVTHHSSESMLGGWLEITTNEKKVYPAPITQLWIEPHIWSFVSRCGTITVVHCAMWVTSSGYLTLSNRSVDLCHLMSDIYTQSLIIQEWISEYDFFFQNSIQYSHMNIHITFSKHMKIARSLKKKLDMDSKRLIFEPHMERTYYQSIYSTMCWRVSSWYNYKID